MITDPDPEPSSSALVGQANLATLLSIESPIDQALAATAAADTTRQRMAHGQARSRRLNHTWIVYWRALGVPEQPMPQPPHDRNGPALKDTHETHAPHQTIPTHSLSELCQQLRRELTRFNEAEAILGRDLHQYPTLHSVLPLDRLVISFAEDAGFSMKGMSSVRRHFSVA